MLKAQVFISCGQLTEEEKKNGIEIVEYFKKMGFEPYFAEEVHSPLGLTQNIYANFKTSEYFVCINHRREGTETGSLFVQQELAIASFLELPLVAFHQPGIKLQGVAKYLHVNSIEFNSIGEIIKHLDKLTAKWDAKSKNQLRLTFGNEKLDVAIMNQDNILSNWYHIIVENLSSVYNANHCYCYIELIDDLSNKKNIFGRREYKNELVWAGTRVVNVDIPNQAKRDIDALYTVHKSGLWSFQEILTSTIYRYPTLNNGTYKIVYVVHSDNFPIAKIELVIELANDRLKVVKQKQIV